MAQRPLIRYPSPEGQIDEVSAGVMPSLAGVKAALWRDSRNVMYRELAVTPEPGQFLLTDKLNQAPVTAIVEAIQNDKKILYWGTPGELYRFDATANPKTIEIADGFTGVAKAQQNVPANLWSLATWGNWLLATNGVNAARIYKHVEPAPILTGVPESSPGVPFNPWTPDIFITVKNYMLAFKGTHFWWCRSDDVEDWVPTTDNDAGDLPIRDTPTPIRAVIPLGEGAGVYSANTLHLVHYVDAPHYFASNRILEGIGAVSKHSVVLVGRVHYGMGPRGIFRTDGTQFQYFDQPPVHRYIYDDYNRNQESRNIAWHDPDNERVCFFWCGKNSDFPNRGLGFDYRNQSFHPLGYARTAASSYSVFNFSITGDNDGNIYQQAIAGIPAIPTADPLVVDAEVDMLGPGYGYGGYGMGPYGGQFIGQG